jgi:hypothetical protein
MKTFFRFKLLPVVAGLITASVIMMLFEFVNSFFYPLPKDFDLSSFDALHTFTTTLPWTAYILVLLGWIVGSFKAGCVATYLAKEEKYKMSLVVGIILTILGILNNLIIGHDMFFNIIGLPMFLVFTYLGHKYLRKKILARHNTL